MKKKILSLCMVIALAAMQIPTLVQATGFANGDVVWEENFEAKAIGANVTEDTEHWAIAEKRGSNSACYDLSAKVSGNEGHKYLKISAAANETAWSSSTAPTLGVVSKSVTDMGLDAGDVYTISYDFKADNYDAAKNGGFAYFHSIASAYATKDNIANKTKDVYIYHKSAKDNKTMVFTHSSQADKLTSIFGAGVRSLPVSDLYTSGWNSLQWVVYPATGNHYGYAELYVNGVYSGTVTNRQGTTSPVALVVAISPTNSADISTSIYLDNIKVVKGAANGTAMAGTTNTVVNVVTTGFEESDLSNGIMPGVSQPGNTTKINNAKDYIVFETAAGKSANDMAMHMYNTVTDPVDTTSLESFEMFAYTNQNSKLYETGDSQEISFDFKFDNVVQPFSISGGRMWSPDGTEFNNSAYKVNNIIKVENKKITVGSTIFAFDEALVAQKWYNIRLVFERGVNSTPFKLYFTRADGNMQVFTGDFYKSYNKVYNGVAKCLISYVGNTNKNRGAWVDNFSIKNYIGGAAPAAVTASDEIEIVDNGDGTVTASAIVDNATNPDAVLIVATYDVTDEGEGFNNAVVEYAGESASTLCEISAKISKGDGQVVKAMLWNGIDTINPLLEVARN